MKYVPFMICVIVFIFTSAGYFITDKKTEKIYGALSIVSIACAIVQAAIVFWKINWLPIGGLFFYGCQVKFLYCKEKMLDTCFVLCYLSKGADVWIVK